VSDLANTNLLYYSLTSEIDYFPSEFVFKFNDDFVGAAAFKETLFAFTKKGFKIIYGNDETDWQIKDGDGDYEFLHRTALTTPRGIIVGVAGDGFYEVSSNTPTKISDRYGDLSKLTDKDAADLANGDWIIIENSYLQDNRYYVCEVTPTTVASGVGTEGDSYRIVFDFIDGGWGTYTVDDKDAWTWRSKEFDFSLEHEPKRLQKISMHYVGQVTVNVYKDGDYTSGDAPLYTRNFDSTIERWDKWLVSNKLGYRWAVEFTGDANAKVFDWKILEIGTMFGRLNPTETPPVTP